MAFPVVNEDNVYSCVGHPLKSDISNVVEWLLNAPFSKAYADIKRLQTLKGLSLLDILTDVHTYVHRLELPQKAKAHLLIKMADLEQRLLNGASENVQLGSLVSAFHGAREMVKEEAGDK